MHYSGSQVMHFTIHSLRLLEQFVQDHSHPAWKSWVAHVTYVWMLLHPTFTKASILELDRAVGKHHELYTNVKEYGKRFRPKNHFATHYAPEILKWGPPRHFWCFGYEAKNQEMKRAGAASNFRDVCGTAMKIIAHQAARSLKKRTLAMAHDGELQL